MQERETGKPALTAHRRVHDHCVTKHAALGGRLSGGASTETPVAHLRRPEYPSRATLTGHETEYCRLHVPHAPTVCQKNNNK